MMLLAFSTIWWALTGTFDRFLGLVVFAKGGLEREKSGEYGHACDHAW